YQLADLFTKALPKERFEYLVHRIVIIMAQQQHAADVHLDELCPPNKRCDLMDANKKVDLEHFWHTLKEAESKHRLKFLLDRKELTLTLDDFRTIFHLPQANDNNHASIVATPSSLICLADELIGKVLLFLHQPVTLIPYPRYDTKIIISHYMTIFPDISRRAQDAYHNLQDDDIMKNIFNSRKNKKKVGMRIPAWMITDEMKHHEHYNISEVFWLASSSDAVTSRLSQPGKRKEHLRRLGSPNPAMESS
ncbi:hypothetical protein Tco_0688820, partial [Tanacetum coccineum]